MWPDCDTSVTYATRVAVRCVSGGMRTLTAVLALGIASLTACGTSAGGQSTPPPPAPSTAPPSPAVKLDAYARQACTKLDSAADKRSNGDPTGANLDEASASIAAARSLAPGLRDIALKYDSDGVHFMEAAPHLREWCYKNQH